MEDNIELNTNNGLSSVSSNELYQEDSKMDNFYQNNDNNLNDWNIDENMFSDENIGEVEKKYNYDYKFLLRELSLYVDYSKLIEIFYRSNNIEYIRNIYE